MTSPASRPTALLYCQVRYGAGHFARSAAIAEALLPHFRVVMAVSGQTGDLRIPTGVDLVPMPEPEEDFLSHVSAADEGLGVALASLAAHISPACLLIESFPFGRQNLLVEMARGLRRIRARDPRPLIVSSVRDIQQRMLPRQDWLDRLSCDTANRFFDAALVHTDPRISRFSDTFPLCAELRPAVHETGYVAPAFQPLPPRDAEPVIVVSAGGGRGGDSLLEAAAAAQGAGLSADFSMRVFAGTFVSDETWQRLQAAARATPRLSVVRWSSDLRKELGRASVSVSRCGYNTALDVLAARVPALFVPLPTPTEDEQRRRAARFAELDLARQLQEDEMSPARLADEIRRTAQWSPSSIDIDLNGARRSAELLRAWVDERRG